MPEGAPIDRGHPTLLLVVIVDDTFGPQLIGTPSIVLVVAVQGEGQTLCQSKAQAFKVMGRPRTRQAEAVGVVEMLKIGVDARRHQLRSDGDSRRLGFGIVGRRCPERVIWRDS